MHIKGAEYDGFLEVVSPPGEDLMGLSLLKLANSETYEDYSSDFEIALVILSGHADIKVDGQLYEAIGQRENVFAGKASCVYIPRDSRYTVHVRDNGFEAALCQVRAEKKYSPFAVRPEEVVIKHVGVGSWQRDVHDIIVDNGNGRVDRIVVGETYGDPGNWSSFPPHKHDRYLPGEETELQEIYHFRVNPVACFGVQVLYGPDGGFGEAHIIRDKDTFIIANGYHPVSSPPSVSLYYLWFLAGTKGRKLQPYDDPHFSNLK